MSIESQFGENCCVTFNNKRGAEDFIVGCERRLSSKKSLQRKQNVSKTYFLASHDMFRVPLQGPFPWQQRVQI